MKASIKISHGKNKEKETANTNNGKDNQDELGYDKRVDIFYDSNKVSKEDIFIR